MVKRILKSKVMPWISLLIGLTATVFILAVLVLRTDFFASNTSRMFSRYLFGGTPFYLKVEEIRGNPFKEITVRGLTIRYRDEDFTYDVVRVDEITCAFDIFTIIRKEPRIRSLTIERPRIWIKPDSSGTHVLPSVGGGGAGGFPAFMIERFAIQGGQVILRGDTQAETVGGISLSGSLRGGGRELFLGIGSGTAENASRNVSLREVTGGVRMLQVGKPQLPSGTATRFLFERLHVVLDESAFTISGSFDADSLEMNLRIEADPLDFEEVARAAGIETSHVGEIQGTLIVRGVPGKVTVGGAVNGIFSGYGLQELNIGMVVDSTGILIERCSGGVNGASVEGSGRYSLAEPAVLSFDVRVTGVDLSAGFVPGRKMPPTDFNGSTRLAYTPSTGRLIFSLDLDAGHLMQFPFEKAILEGGYSNDSLLLDRVVLTHPGHTVNMHGTLVDGEYMKFFIDLSCSRDDTLFSYFGIEEYRADLDVNGIYEGTPDHWNLRSSGMVSNFTYGGASVPAGEIKLALVKDTDYHLYLDLVADSCFYDPVGFSGLYLSLEYQNDVTSIKKLRLERPSLGINMRMDVTSRTGLAEVDFSEMFIDAFGERWTGSGSFNATVRDSTVAINDVQFHSRLGALYLGGVLDRMHGTFDGDLSFERLNLVTLNLAGLLSRTVGGVARGSISCSGALSDPVLDVSLSVVEARFDTLSADSLQLRIRYSDGRFSFDTLAVAATTGNFGMRGHIAGVRIVDVWRRDAAALRAATVEIDMECSDLLLRPILSVTAGETVSGGSFSGRISVSDSLVHPDIRMEGRIAKLSARSFTVPAADLSLRVTGRGMDVSGTMSIGPGHEGTFRGKIPVHGAKWFYALALDDPILIEFILPMGSFEDVTKMTDVVAEAQGKFSAVFNITGTPRLPKILGELTLADASFRLAGMEEKFYKVQAKVLLEDTLVVLKKLEGKEGKDGSFSCRGWISLRGWRPVNYRFDVGLDDILVASVPDILAITSGTLLVVSKSEENRVIPVITGSLGVKEAEVFYDIGDFASAQRGGTLAPTAWIAAVDIDIPGNAWLKTADANVELRGKITLYHDQRGTYLRGELGLARGWYNVYNNKFRVISGKLAFVLAGSFRPVVDIEAETRDTEGRKIYLDLAWHQDDIEPRLSLRHEDPGYSETDIWKMLGGGVVGASSSQGTNWDALSTAQNLAANYIERMLNSQMEGMTIELERTHTSGSDEGSFEESETMIAVGKYLSEGLYVKYRQGLSISSARQIEVEYRISDLFLLRSEVVRYSEKVLQGKSKRSTDEINVDFKLRWEF